VAIVDDFRAIEREFPEGWETVRLRLTVPDDADCARAAALLGPTNPGRHGKVIHFELRRGGVSVDTIRELLRRLGAERIDGSLELVEAVSREAPAEAAEVGLAAAWDEAVAALPDDWSDLYAEIALPSTDYIEPGALRLSPLNPRRDGHRAVFGFRAARKFGYGAASEMVRRCLERLDEAGITGALRIVDVFSDTYPVKTQGPVWYSRGRVVR
jgi:hypothetical protein